MIFLLSQLFLSFQFSLYLTLEKYTKFVLFILVNYVLLLWCYGCFLDGQIVKNLPTMQETRLQPLSQEDPLEKEMVTCSSILA